MLGPGSGKRGTHARVSQQVIKSVNNNAHGGQRLSEPKRQVQADSGANQIVKGATNLALLQAVLSGGYRIRMHCVRHVPSASASHDFSDVQRTRPNSQLTTLVITKP